MQAGQWECEECGNARDLGLLESQMNSVVMQIVRRDFVQDLVCSKCRMVGILNN